jgi:methylmalonyl-CoA mutase cobalamin-binding domain/chain
MTSDILGAVRDTILNLDVNKAEEAVDEALKKGVPALKILNEMAEAMRVMGKRYEDMEVFLADLIMAAEVFNKGMKVLKPLLADVPKTTLSATVVIGTAKGDIHDIGKNIVTTMLTAAGLQVHDVGVDTPPERFIEKLREVDGQILAMSALLSTSAENIGEVMELLEKESMRKKVKVMIGGAAVSEALAKDVGADAYGEEAVDAVEICKRFVKEKKHKSP